MKVRQKHTLWRQLVWGRSLNFMLTYVQDKSGQ